MSKAKALALLLQVMLLIYALTSVQAHGRPAKASPQLSSSPEYYYARYRINGPRPTGFAEVAYLVVGVKNSPKDTRYDEKGDALIKGELLTDDGTSYRFAAAKLIRSATLRRDGCGLFTQLSLTTESKEGTSYSFDGQFLEEPEEVKRGNFISFISLVGVLSKIRDGQKVAEAKVDFTRLGIE